MTSQGRTTSKFPVKTTLFDNSDRVVILYGASTANTTGAIAQTATIEVTKLFSGNGSLNIPVHSADPVNATATTIAKGSVFATPTFLYVAVADNLLGRVALDSSF